MKSIYIAPRHDIYYNDGQVFNYKLTIIIIISESSSQSSS